jgi:tetratricopeptide (TPR) repeat protein
VGRGKTGVNASLDAPNSPSLRKLWPVWAVLTACVWIAFAPALSNGFVDWDDHDWILKNPSFQGLGWDQIRFAFTTLMGGVYQPLGWLLQSLVYELFGLEPRGYHLVSLLLHVLNVILFHLLCLRIVATSLPETANRLGRALGWLCAIPVALYAVHPLRVEPVAWASCQAYLPGVTFSLLAILAYLRAHPAGGVDRRRWMVGSSVLVVLAVLTKASAVVLPFVFLILDAYPLGRLGPGFPSWPAARRVLMEKGVILVVCLALTAVAFGAKRLWEEPEVTAGPVPVARVAQASFGAWFYLAKTVWPFGITAFYPRPERGDFLTPLFAACVAGVLVAWVLAFWQRRRRPWLLAALAAYLVIASPYLGLARVGTALAADRYSYAPTMVWVVLACAGLCKLAERPWSRPAWLGAGAGTLAITCGLMVLCSAQCRVWTSSEHLWGQALQEAGWSADVHHFMGTALADSGKLDDAIAEFRAALRIRPHDYETACDLGAVLDRRGETDAAIACLRETARLGPKDARVLLNLGGALMHHGDVDEAIAVYREALRIQPESPELQFNLGAALFHREKVDEAIAHYREALRIQPDFPRLHFHLGVALAQQGKVDEAISALSRAVEQQPGYSKAYAMLGGAFALQGRQAAAVSQYRKALQLEPNDSESRISLGLALARQGRADEAITQLRQAIQRDRKNAKAHHVLASILVSVRRFDEATAEFRDVLRLQPDHAQARVALAKLGNRRR